MLCIKKGSKKMRILMLTWEYPPRVVGGIARVVNDLSKRLIKDGHDVTVVTYREGDAPYYELDKGVKVYRVDNFMINPNNFIDWVMQLNFNMVAKTGEIIAKEGKFDVIHAHDWLVAYAAKTLKQAYDMPIVSTIHATESGRNSGIHDETQRYINDTEWMLTYESSEVIVNSNYMKNELQRLFGLPYEKINVIPNGVNMNLFNGIERDYNFRRKFAMDNEKIILFIGRLVYEKGVQHLIAAMPKILEGYHDTKLVIAGKGGMIDELKAQVEALGISQKVYFAGYLGGKDVQKMYNVIRKNGGIWLDPKEENIGILEENGIDFEKYYEKPDNLRLNRKMPKYNGPRYIIDYGDIIFLDPKIVRDAKKNGKHTGWAIIRSKK